MTAAASILDRLVPSGGRVRPAGRWLTEHGWPDRRDEAWRYAPLETIATASQERPPMPSRGDDTSLDPAPRSSAQAQIRWLLSGHPSGAAGRGRIVLIDGRHHRELSDLPAEVGVTVDLDVRAAPFTIDERTDGFEALNHLATTGVTRIHSTAPGATAELHIVHVSTDAREASHPRTEVHLAPGSRLVLVETFWSLPGAGLTNTATTVDVGADAHLEHVQLTHTTTASAHVATTRLVAHDRSSVRSGTLLLGPGTARHTLSVLVDGVDAAVDLGGLSMPAEGAHHDTAVSVRHLASHGTSRQRYAGIVGDGARSSFSGHIVVAAGTAGTNADQQNRNLLLGPTARADSRPWLEICSDDVACTHGATVGRLDHDSLFYLRSRGIPERDACAMLVAAFATTVSAQLAPAGATAEWIAAITARAIDGLLATPTTGGQR